MKHMHLTFNREIIKIVSYYFLKTEWDPDCSFIIQESMKKIKYFVKI